MVEFNIKQCSCKSYCPFTYLTEDIKSQTLGFGLRLDSCRDEVSKPWVILHLKNCVGQMFQVNEIYKCLGYNPEKMLMPNVSFLADFAQIYLVKLSVSQEKAFLSLYSYFNS